jgi:uncharacterized protein (DUF362 family)
VDDAAPRAEASGAAVTLTRRRFLAASLAAPALRLYARLPVSEVAVVEAAQYPTLAAAVRAAVSAVGGVEFVKPGQSVLLKPALNSGKPYPATADPETVLTIARMVLGAGGKPFIADRTMFLHSTRDAFEKTRMIDAAREAGIECVALEDTPVVDVMHPLATGWPDSTVPVYKLAAEADHVVNLCTPRTHKLGDLTMAIKNNVGIVGGKSRLRMHSRGGLKARLAEIALVMRPALIVLDARQGFADGGPDEGALVRPGLIVAGRDPLAVDAIGVAILRMQGTNAALSTGSIWSIPMLQRAAELGLGATSPSSVRLLGREPLLASIRSTLA